MRLPLALFLALVAFAQALPAQAFQRGHGYPIPYMKNYWRGLDRLNDSYRREAAAAQRRGDPTVGFARRDCRGDYVVTRIPGGGTDGHCYCGHRSLGMEMPSMAAGFRCENISAGCYRLTIYDAIISPRNVVAVKEGCR